MSEPKWTPGPWCYDSYNSIYSGAGESAKTICSIPDHPQDGSFATEQIQERSAWYRESAANADLIAAAPDLYYALAKYVDHFGDPLKVARPALAKAMGEQTAAHAPDGAGASDKERSE